MKHILLVSAVIVMLFAFLALFTACSTNGLPNMPERTETVSEGFNVIDIESDTADLIFIPSENGECKIVYNTHKKIRYTATVENGVLSVAVKDMRIWIEKIFNFRSSTLTVHLPAGAYTSLSVKQDTGDISIPTDYRFESVDIELSTGDTSLYASADKSVIISASTGNIELENLSCGSLNAKGSTGKIEMKNVSVAGDATLTVSSGDIILENVKFKNLTAIGNTGDISATLLSGSENLIIERSTGDISMSNVNCGRNINVSTSTGEIDANTLSCEDITATVSSGKINFTNTHCVNFTTVGNTGDININDLIASEKIDIERSTGDVNLDACDAEEIYVMTDTGDVMGTLLTNKIFQVETSTGKIDVPECLEGGKCKITTDTGNVKISIER